MDGATSLRQDAGSEAPLSTLPVIGVSPCLDAGQRLRAGVDYWYLARNYTRALVHTGAAPIVLSADTPVEVCADLCEGLVLSGGDDLPRSFADPAFASGAWKDAVPGKPEAFVRIGWERALLDAFAARGKPVLGVCFGMQLMNLHFGGTLIVNLGGRGTGLDHGGGGRTTHHPIEVSPASSFLAGIELPSEVNSSHRQAVDAIAPGFTAGAWTSDGVVEVIERGNLIGVEWHPESDASGAAIYARFVARVLGRR